MPGGFILLFIVFSNIHIKQVNATFWRKNVVLKIRIANTEQKNKKFKKTNLTDPITIDPDIQYYVDRG